MRDQGMYNGGDGMNDEDENKWVGGKGRTNLPAQGIKLGMKLLTILLSYIVFRV